MSAVMNKNFRLVCWFVVVFLIAFLLFEWNSDKKRFYIESHMVLAERELKTPLLNNDSVKIENGLMSVTVSIKSGSIIEARLKEYPVENVEGALGVRVFGYEKQGVGEEDFSYYFKSGFTGQASVYEVDYYDSGSVRLVNKESGQYKLISFSKDSYEVLIEDGFPSFFEGKAYAGLYRTSGGSLDLKKDWLSGGMMNSGSYQGVAFSLEDAPYETSRLRGLDEGVEHLSRGGWVAFIQKYFFASIIGSEDYIYNYFAYAPVDESGEKDPGGVYRMGYVVESSNVNSGDNTHTHRLFIGPKIRKDLMNRAPNLELSIDMGWFWFLAQPMVSTMDFLNGFVNSWGITIIIFTVLIKLIFWPITAKSFSSMAAMRRIAPDMAEIKERYKDDRQKQGTETMKLMKQHGANPLGGCLPMLIQMPFFIGFFFALRELVELRHSSLGIWQDLSVPDPFFIMPVLFAFLMFLTQRLNPQPVGMDETQAQVMKFMPIMFSFFFIVLPAGLGLYMVVNTSIQLLQQTMSYKKQGALGQG